MTIPHSLSLFPIPQHSPKTNWNFMIPPMVMMMIDPIRFRLNGHTMSITIAINTQQLVEDGWRDGSQSQLLQLVIIIIIITICVGHKSEEFWGARTFSVLSYYCDYYYYYSFVGGCRHPPSIAIYRPIRSPEPKSSPPLTRNKWGSCWDRSRVASHEVDAEDVAGTDEWDEWDGHGKTTRSFGKVKLRERLEITRHCLLNWKSQTFW